MTCLPECISFVYGFNTILTSTWTQFRFTYCKFSPCSVYFQITITSVFASIPLPELGSHVRPESPFQISRSDDTKYKNTKMSNLSWCTWDQSDVTVQSWTANGTSLPSQSLWNDQLNPVWEERKKSDNSNSLNSLVFRTPGIPSDNQSEILNETFIIIYSP